MSLEFYLPAQLRLCLPGFNTIIYRPSVDSILYLESNVPNKLVCNPEKVGGFFKSWNFTSFMSEKSVQWTCS